MSFTGERLRIARQRKGFKQIQVKEKTGIHNKTLSGYENNVAEPDLTTLKTLATLYEVSVEWLIGNTDDPDPNKFSPDEEQFLKDINLPLDKLLEKYDFGMDLTEDEIKDAINYIKAKRIMKERE